MDDWRRVIGDVTLAWLSRGSISAIFLVDEAAVGFLEMECIEFWGFCGLVFVVVVANVFTVFDSKSACQKEKVPYPGNRYRRTRKERLECQLEGFLPV